MNLLRWTRHEQLAAGVLCIIGALCGIFFAWTESPFRKLSANSLSGEWSDYTGVFLIWLRHGHYWPWPVMGAVVAGLVGYVIQLLRETSAPTG
jgi:hypothetical protein